GASRRTHLHHESGCHRHPLSPRGPRRRIDGWLPLGRGPQEDAAAAGAAVMPTTLHHRTLHHGHGGRGGQTVPDSPSVSSVSSVVESFSALDWPSIESSLDAQGFATMPAILSPDGCESLAALYQNESLFRRRVEMARFRFGVGEYKYFAAPLPPIVQTLREDLYARLAPIATRWLVRLTASAKATAVKKSEAAIEVRLK